MKKSDKTMNGKEIALQAISELELKIERTATLFDHDKLVKGKAWELFLNHGNIPSFEIVEDHLWGILVKQTSKDDYFKYCKRSEIKGKIEKKINHIEGSYSFFAVQGEIEKALRWERAYKKLSSFVFEI